MAETPEEELRRLEAENEAAAEWGAAVGARHERIKALRALIKPESLVARLAGAGKAFRVYAESLRGHYASRYDLAVELDRCAEACEAALSGEPPQPDADFSDWPTVAGPAWPNSPQPVADAGDAALSPSDPALILAGIRQFGLAPDGTDLRDLETAITRLSEQIASLTKERDEVIERSRERLVDNQRLRKLIASTHKNTVKHENCEKEFCPICEGGLFMCADCGAAEIEAEERICPAAESRLAELEQEAVKVVEFYADKESYRNRPIDEQRKLLNGGDPTVAITGYYKAPPGLALSDIQMDRYGNRARAFLDKLRRPS